MTDDQFPGPFVPPSAPGYPPQPDAGAGQVPGYPQAGGQSYPPGVPGQYPQPGQQWPGPYGPYQVQPPRRRTGMLVGGIVLTFGGLAALGTISAAANGLNTATSSDPAYMAGRMVGFLSVVLLPLVGGIIMIVRSKRR